MKEDETFEEMKARKDKGNRGKSSERLVELVLEEMKENDPGFDFDRLPDTRSAGRIMPARVSDFTLFYHEQAISLEVKEVKDGKWSFSLNKAKFPQLPRMRRRAMAGCQGLLVVHLIQQDVWCWIWTRFIRPGDKSLDLTGDHVGKANSASAALKEALICRSTF